MDTTKPPLRRRLFTLTWEGAYRWLIGLALSSIVTWLSHRKMPSAVAHPAEYWFLAGGVFFGSLVGFLSFAQFIAWLFRQLRTLWHPPRLIITAHGGRNASVELQYFGVPTMWEARIRILEMTGNTFNPNPPNPNPLLRQCYLEKGGESHRAMKLMDGDVVSIVLAEMKYSHYLSSHRETWVAVPNADDERDTRVSGDTTIELNLTTNPIQKKLAIKKCFKVSRSLANAMECLEVLCK
jgi:hypothetical protein